MAISGNTIAHEALVDQNAVDWRRQFQRMLGYDFVAAAGVGSGGVARSGDCAVSQRGAGANMSVDVAAGFIAVGENSGGTGATGTAGVWTGYNDAVLNVPISASDPVNPRIDRIGFGIRDTAYSGATNDGQITVITGTPAGVPAVPAVPATYIAWVDLAQVAVAALAATIVNANITDKRQRLSSLGGITVCTSSTRPTTNLWEGLTIYETDTDYLQVYDGAAWVPAGQAARSWTVITDTLLGSDTTISFSSIPATFTHLMVILSGRGNAAVASGAPVIRLNGDTGANYDTAFIGYSSGFGALANRSDGQTAFTLGDLPGTSATANRAGIIELLLPDYRSTTFHKTARFTGGVDDSGAKGSTITWNGTWRSTAAINAMTIDFNAAGTGWKAGTRATLLGIR